MCTAAAATELRAALSQKNQRKSGWSDNVSSVRWIDDTFVRHCECLGCRGIMCSHVGTKGAGCEAIRRPCCLLMIRFVLVQNRQGKVRLAKYYVRMVEAEKAQIPGEVFRVIAPRDQRSQSNFVEVRKRSRDADISVGVGERGV